MWVLNVSRFDEFWRVIFLGWRLVDQPPMQAQKLSLISRLTYTKKTPLLLPLLDRKLRYTYTSKRLCIKNHSSWWEIYKSSRIFFSFTVKKAAQKWRWNKKYPLALLLRMDDGKRTAAVSFIGLGCYRKNRYTSAAGGGSGIPIRKSRKERRVP